MFLSSKLSCLALVVFAPLTITPSSTQLKGVVTDQEGAAIRGAHVFVHWDHSGAGVGLKANVGLKQDLILETDDKGEFTAELPPGFYDVFVAATAFSPQCRKIWIKQGETATYKATLKVDPLVAGKIGDKFPH